MARAQFLQGHVIDVLRDMPEESVHCVVTSPPYWSLRDYGLPPQDWSDGWRGSLGLEPTPELYVQHIVEVFREVKRVLRPDGTLWLNMGSSYQDKQELGIPWRVALALQADGWYLRSDIIWSKLNPMPESVTDRPTKSHEYLFLLTKAATYYYDQDAIREPQADGTFKRYKRGEAIPGYSKSGGSARKKDSFISATPMAILPHGRNKRTVWDIATQPFPEAHFATFPEKLVEPCILAGTSEKGCCPECGAPWERILERTDEPDVSAKGSRFDKGKTGARDGGDRTQPGDLTLRRSIGWQPSCDHGLDPVPCTVLDPFVGSGTTCLVAMKLGRHSIGIDLSQEYIEMAQKRIGYKESLL